jgi:hypothetical protein
LVTNALQFHPDLPDKVFQGYHDWVPIEFPDKADQGHHNIQHTDTQHNDI